MSETVPACGLPVNTTIVSMEWMIARRSENESVSCERNVAGAIGCRDGRTSNVGSLQSSLEQRPKVLDFLSVNPPVGSVLFQIYKPKRLVI
jgi:hypothetical protein